MAFPNLTTLKVFCEVYYRENGRKDISDVDMTPDHLKLQLPNLRTLDIQIDRLENFVFRPTVFPTRLRQLNVDQIDIAMQIFESLPVVSVGGLDIDIRQFIGEPSEEFYTATNRLLGQTTITGEVGLRLDTGLFLELELDRIKWINLTKLELASPNPGVCVQYLDPFPQLTKLLTECLKSNRTYLEVGYYPIIYNDLSDLKGHGLMKLIVRDEWNLWNSNNVTELASVLAGNIESLKGVALE